ncbi:TonB-dependent receptor, partial [Klebsiella variicola]|uniref:TonB-dependent receptor n=1 Tax=Klebsiella variicola TaxID=244366 RepID=UPI0027316965
MNLTAFYYDYTDYQVSQIVDRISLNENFDARMMGLELETVFQPTPNLRLDANIGYLDTKIGDGEGSIDVMNRTQGNPDWMVLRPW